MKTLPFTLLNSNELYAIANGIITEAVALAKARGTRKENAEKDKTTA